MDSVACCVAFLRENHPELADLVEVWDRLPDVLKAGIKAMVKEVEK